MTGGILSQNIMERILNKIGALVKMKAIINAPIDDGQLRSSIDYEINLKENSVMIKADAEHAQYVEYGTGIYHVDEKGNSNPKEPIRPKNKEVLAWTAKGTARPSPDDSEEWARLRKEGKAFIAKEVKGQAPHPFMRPAVHQSIPDIKRIIATEMTNGNH